MPASPGPVWSGGGGSPSHDRTLSPDADGLLNKAGDHDSSAKTAVKTPASSFLLAARWMLSSANPRSETYTHKSTPVIAIFLKKFLYSNKPACFHSLGVVFITSIFPLSGHHNVFTISAKVS